MTFRIDDNFDVNNKVDEPKLEDFQNNQQGIILCIMPKPKNKKPNGKNLHMHNAQCTMHNNQHKFENLQKHKTRTQATKYSVHTFKWKKDRLLDYKFQILIIDLHIAI